MGPQSHGPAPHAGCMLITPQNTLQARGSRPTSAASSRCTGSCCRSCGGKFARAPGVGPRGQGASPPRRPRAWRHGPRRGRSSCDRGPHAAAARRPMMHPGCPHLKRIQWGMGRFCFAFLACVARRGRGETVRPPLATSSDGWAIRLRRPHPAHEQALGAEGLVRRHGGHRLTKGRGRSRRGGHGQLSNSWASVTSPPNSAQCPPGDPLGCCRSPWEPAPASIPRPAPHPYRPPVSSG